MKIKAISVLISLFCINIIVFSFEKDNSKKETAGRQNIESEIPENMVLVKGGVFEMGNDKGFEDERPRHQVSLKDFYISKYEVTVKEYLIFLAEDKRHYPEWLKPGNQFNVDDGADSYYKILGDALKAEDYPIVGVSWHNAIAYCKWLSKKTGKEIRLPTEAEWEFAAGGGNKSKGFIYSGSDNVDEIGWHSNISDGKTHKVGTKSPNELGLYDMSGNVWEWCYDKYANDYYEHSPTENPQGAEKGQDRVLRGGSWYNFSDFLRITFRYNVSSGVKNRNIGFRIAMTP